MMIFNLIFICVCTVLFLISGIASLSEDSGKQFLFSVLSFICGILAIVFQSLNL